MRETCKSLFALSLRYRVLPRCRLCVAPHNARPTACAHAGMCWLMDSNHYDAGRSISSYQSVRLLPPSTNFGKPTRRSTVKVATLTIPSTRRLPMLLRVSPGLPPGRRTSAVAVSSSGIGKPKESSAFTRADHAMNREMAGVTCNKKPRLCIPQACTLVLTEHRPG